MYWRQGKFGVKCVAVLSSDIITDTSRQHLDDCAESFLMAAFHNSQLFTMKANYWNKEKDLRIIRPLVYVRETETRKFAEGNKLPIIPENCPACFSEPKERNRMKQLLAQQEILHPNIFHSLRKEIVEILLAPKYGLNQADRGRPGEVRHYP